MGYKQTLSAALILLLLMCSAVSAAWTKGELMDFVRQGINQTDSTKSGFTEAQIRDYVQRAVNYLSTKDIGIAKDTSIVVVKNQTDYALPSDFIYEKGVVLRIGDADSVRSLKWSEQLYYGLRYTGSMANLIIRPEEYTILSDSLIKIAPMPRINADTIEISYMAVQSLDEDTSTCLLPDGVQEALINYAISLCKGANYDDQGMQLYKQLADGIIDNYLATTSRKPTVPTVIPPLKDSP